MDDKKRHKRQRALAVRIRIVRHAVWRAGADGSAPKQLTDGLLDAAPRCSPDGQWVFYEDAQALQIKRVSIDGGVSEVEPGTTLPGAYVEGGFSISPDGKLLAFVTTGETGALVHQIALVALNAGTKPARRMLLPDLRVSAGLQFTSDGQAVIYPILENGTDNLWLRPLDGSGGHQIIQFKSDRTASFQFSPDGKTLGLLRSHAESDAVLLRDEASTPH